MRSLRQIAKRRCSMPFSIVHSVGINNLAIRTDHDPNTGRFFLIGAFSGAVSNSDRFIDVAQKFAWQADFVPPFLQIFRRAEGDPQNDGVFIGKILGSSTEPVRLLASIIAECTWIEPQHNVLSRVIRQTYIHPILIG